MTEQEKTQAILMRCRGLSYRTIAKVLGCVHSTIQFNLKPKVRERNRQYQKRWYQTNAQQVKLKSQIWYKNNLEQAKKSRQIWAKANPEQKREQGKRWRKVNAEKERFRLQSRPKRKKENISPNSYLSILLRNRLRSALKGISKKGSAVRDLGCTIDDLRIHLQEQFAPGMTWDNWAHDGWHIDHIRPLASFDLENIDELHKACHYTNLQPLWAQENLRKGARV